MFEFEALWVSLGTQSLSVVEALWVSMSNVPLVSSWSRLPKCACVCLVLLTLWCFGIAIFMLCIPDLADLRCLCIWWLLATPRCRSNAQTAFRFLLRGSVHTCGVSLPIPKMSLCPHIDYSCLTMCFLGTWLCCAYVKSFCAIPWCHLWSLLVRVTCFGVRWRCLMAPRLLFIASRAPTHGAVMSLSGRAFYDIIGASYGAVMFIFSILNVLWHHRCHLWQRHVHSGFHQGPLFLWPGSRFIGSDSVATMRIGVMYPAPLRSSDLLLVQFVAFFAHGICSVP